MSITAETLIYTNVEVEQSPTKQRGFQVWQTSAGLTAAQKKEITRRVDDYVLPIGTTPEAAAEFFIREAFFPLSDGSLAVARTTPLREPDKFKRGGRFFAHVFVITKADFEASGSDPFAFLAAARFTSHPSQIEEPLKGTIPCGELKIVASSDVAPVSASLTSTIVGHLDREPGKQKTIVLVGKPTEIVGKLRPLYRLLPPQLRGSYAFDSFSLGSGLTHSPCAFVGCPTPEALRMWAYRRFVKLDPETGAFAPAADPALRPLYAKLTASPLWCEADDVGRAAAWQAVELIEAKDYVALADLFENRPNAEGILSELPEYLSAVEGVKAAKVGQCPKLLAEDANVRAVLDATFQVPTRELLRLLNEPLPHRKLAQAFTQSLEAGRELTESELTELEAWHAGIDGLPILKAMTDRLRYQNPQELQSLLNAETAEAGRFGHWVRSRFELVGINMELILKRFGHGAQPTPRDFYDAKLYQAAFDCSEVDAQLKFRMAYHDGPAAVEAYVKAGHKPPAEDIGSFLRPRLILGWQPLQSYEFAYFLGGYFYPGSDADISILEQMQESMGLRPGRKMLREFLPKLQARTYEKLPTQMMLSPPAQAFFQDVLTMKPGPTRTAKVEQLRQSLAAGSEAFFFELFGIIRARLIPEDHHEPPNNPPHDAYLFGYKLRWLDGNDSKTNLPTLLEILLGSLTPELRRDERPKTASPPGDRLLYVLRLLG